jgi:hypothetical protein
MELVSLGSEFGVEVRGIGLLDVASSDSEYLVDLRRGT